jgi:hypothetical protein
VAHWGRCGSHGSSGGFHALSLAVANRHGTTASCRASSNGIISSGRRATRSRGAVRQCRKQLLHGIARTKCGRHCLRRQWSRDGLAAPIPAIRKSQGRARLRRASELAAWRDRSARSPPHVGGGNSSPSTSPSSWPSWEQVPARSENPPSAPGYQAYPGSAPQTQPGRPGSEATPSGPNWQTQPGPAPSGEAAITPTDSSASSSTRPPPRTSRPPSVKPPSVQPPSVRVVGASHPVIYPPRKPPVPPLQQIEPPSNPQNPQPAAPVAAAVAMIAAAPPAAPSGGCAAARTAGAGHYRAGNSTQFPASTAHPSPARAVSCKAHLVGVANRPAVDPPCRIGSARHSVAHSHEGMAAPFAAARRPGSSCRGYRRIANDSSASRHRLPSHHSSALGRTAGHDTALDRRIALLKETIYERRQP